jgi:hypothetical protein
MAMGQNVGIATNTVNAVRREEAAEWRWLPQAGWKVRLNE